MHIKYRKLRIQFQWTIAGLLGLNLAWLAAVLFYSVKGKFSIDGFVTGLMIINCAALLAGLFTDFIQFILDKGLCNKNDLIYAEYVIKKSDKEKNKLRKEYFFNLFNSGKNT